MPTFIFFRNKTKIDRITGADPALLESKIQQYLSGDDGSDGDVGVQGHVRFLSVSSPGFIESV